MSPRQKKWAREVYAVLKMAEDDRGDWMEAIEDVADDLTEAGFEAEAKRLRKALKVVQDGGSADWLVMIESVAEDLS